MTLISFDNNEKHNPVNISEPLQKGLKKTLKKSGITKKTNDVMHSTVSSPSTSSSTALKLSEKIRLPTEEVQSIATNLLNFLNDEKNNDDAQTAFIQAIPKNILGEAVQYFFKNYLNEENKDKLQRLLFLNFHSFEEYFSFLEHYHYILPAGVRAVVEYLQTKRDPEKSPTINLPCTVFDSPDNLVQHVINSSQKEEDLPEILITCCRTIQGTIGKHITPLLLKKVDSNTLFLVWTDSISYYDNLSHELSRIRTGLHHKGIKLHVFYLGSARQCNGTDCSTFSIHDAINFSMYHKTILSQCLAQNLITTPQESTGAIESLDSSSDEEEFDSVDPTREPDVHALSNLPHRFFWLTHKPEAADVILKTLGPEEREQFQSKYQKHCITIPEDKTHNIRSTVLARKFEGIIWNTIISRS